jgi:hypothetical protein
MGVSASVQGALAKTKTSKVPTPTHSTPQRNTIMKKIIIALAAVSALAAGASAAQAHGHHHGHFNLYFGGYGNQGYNNNYYSEPVYSDYQPECHYVTVKKVFWQDGYKYVKYVNKLVCNSY